MTITLITCSGFSNTGRLTTQSALTLLHRMPGRFRWIQARDLPGEAYGPEIRDAEQVIVIDGCMDCCALKKFSASGTSPSRHIVATGIGIVKDGMADVQFHEIEVVVQEILKGNS